VIGLAALYSGLLDNLELADVTVIGNSVGGWIAAEMGVAGSPRVKGIVLLDAVGIEVEGRAVADVSDRSVSEIQALSFHDPTPFRVDLTTIPDAQRAVMVANAETLAVYAGSPAMADPTLLARLSAIAVPTLVLLGRE
jgi:pimeloyl-ACP methyl ester carboxylesterase